MTGIELIAAERKRQVENEGWDAEHDVQHDCDELVRAAVSYAILETHIVTHRSGVPINGLKEKDLAELFWPWDDPPHPKPKRRLKNLVRAGALIAAEIDRLQRAAP